MKPVGRERNEYIAKLLGWTRFVPNSNLHWKDSDGNIVKDGIDWQPSTNRNDTWELWDELVKAYPDTGIFFYQDEMNCSIETDMSNDLNVKGKDFADCVSQAWITWKEQNEHKG